MAKERMPFELKRPNAGTPVTNASEIDYGDIPAACGLIYDISVAHTVNNVPAQYESLSAALGTNGANIPQDVRRGGMAVKFINSSTNKYEQWLLKASSFSTTTSDWISVTDPVAENIGYGESNVKLELDKISDFPINVNVENLGTVYFSMSRNFGNKVCLYISEGSTLEADVMFVGINKVNQSYSVIERVAFLKGEYVSIGLDTTINDIWIYFGSASNVTTFGTFVGSVVSEVSSDIHNTKYNINLISKIFNIDVLSYDKNCLHVGTLIYDGSVNSDTNYKYTDYIPVISHDIHIDNCLPYRICYYDSSKTKMYYEQSESINANYLANASYIRLAFANVNNSYELLRIYFGIDVVDTERQCENTASQVSAINNTLNNVLSLAYDKSCLHTGTVLYDGGVNSDAAYKYTDYIDIVSDNISINGCTFYRVCYYDSNKQKIYYEQSNSINASYLHSSAYIRLAFTNSDNDYDLLNIYFSFDLTKIDSNEGKIEKVEKELSEVLVKKYDNADLETGCLVYTGLKNDDSNFKTTDYIDVVSNVITIVDGTLFRICYYDNNYNLIKYEQSTTIDSSLINASKYVRMSFANTANNYDILSIYLRMLSDGDLQIKNDVKILKQEIGKYEQEKVVTANTIFSYTTVFSGLNISLGDKFTVSISTDAEVTARFALYINNIFINGIANGEKREITFDTALLTKIGSDTITSVGFQLTKDYISTSGTATMILLSGLSNEASGGNLIESFLNAPQINNSLHSTSASAAQIAYDKRTAMVGVVTHGGWLAYGEASKCVYLDIFQLSNPYNVKHIIIAEKGSSTGATTGVIGNVSEVNVLFIGNFTWRVFFPINNYWSYRDYHYDTDVLDDAVRMKWEDNSYVEWINSQYAENYLASKGYTFDRSVSTILTSTLYIDNGRVYGVASAEGGVYPILYYSDDNMATLTPYAVYPQPCYYEASMCKVGTAIYLIGRGDSSNNHPNTYAVSTDNGETWTIGNRGGDNNRPRIYNYNGHCLWFHGVSGRQAFQIKYGDDFLTAQVLYECTTPWMCVYASLLVQNNQLYMAYSDGQTNLVENYQDYPQDGINAKGKDELKFIRLGSI